LNRLRFRSQDCKLHPLAYGVQSSEFLGQDLLAFGGDRKLPRAIHQPSGTVIERWVVLDKMPIFKANQPSKELPN
jgi:hypothetical protein